MSSESVEVVGDKTAEEDAEELLGYAVMMEKTITVNVDGGDKAAAKQGIFIENSNVQFTADKPAIPMVEPVRPVAVNGVEVADQQSGKKVASNIIGGTNLSASLSYIVEHKIRL